MACAALNCGGGSTFCAAEVCATVGPLGAALEATGRAKILLGEKLDGVTGRRTGDEAAPPVRVGEVN